jgi:hypothetical protein
MTVGFFMQFSSASKNKATKEYLMFIQIESIDYLVPEILQQSNLVLQKSLFK